jgi:hypothetical protein
MVTPRLTVPLIGLALGVWAIAVVTAQPQPLELIDRGHAAIGYAQPSHDPVASFLQSPAASR